jgi:hypothetical protein
MEDHIHAKCVNKVKSVMKQVITSLSIINKMYNNEKIDNLIEQIYEERRNLNKLSIKKLVMLKNKYNEILTEISLSIDNFVENLNNKSL